MKKILTLIAFLLNGYLLSGQTQVKADNSPADRNDVNYDETKVGNYELPILLKTADGKRVTSVRTWNEQRRPAILQLFKDHVYGEFPRRLAGQHFKIISIDSAALNGRAICKQITLFFQADEHGPKMELLLYLPKKVGKPVAVFTGLNYYGNQGVHPDPQIRITSQWVRNVRNESGSITNNKATETSRGITASRWAVDSIIDRGYGMLTAYYGDLEPDHPDGWRNGVRALLQKPLETNASAWGAIGAWAWGLSRMMDYCESDPSINARKVIAVGHSRLGKAALWAVANDNRYAAVISNNSGEGGAALARRNFGETIYQINTSFAHWFSPAFKKYNGNPHALPVDQHMLLALVAPRPLYVASAEDDPWADPKGEFLSAVHAEPVYRLFQKIGLGVKDMPPVNTAVGENIHYHIRTGKHGITAFDWTHYLHFADKHFAGRR